MIGVGVKVVDRIQLPRSNIVEGGDGIGNGHKRHKRLQYQ